MRGIDPRNSRPTDAPFMLSVYHFITPQGCILKSTLGSLGLVCFTLPFCKPTKQILRINPPPKPHKTVRLTSQTESFKIRVNMNEQARFSHKLTVPHQQCLQFSFLPPQALLSCARAWLLCFKYILWFRI